MRYFSKIFLYFILLFIAVWIIPWCYAFFQTDHSYPGLTLYSPISKNFLMVRVGESDLNRMWMNIDGTVYTREESDSLLPFFFIRQLVSDGRFPDSVCGTPVTAQLASANNFTFYKSAYDTNQNSPKLYPLMESQSKRVDLEMPSDVFRITDSSIEFIDMESKEINTSKSNLFTSVMNKKGFNYPATIVNGNPTTRKEYDDGYLILDANHKLFHLKQNVGRPFVRAVETPDSINLEQAFLTEFKSHKIIGLVCDDKGHIFVLQNDYQLKLVDVGPYDPHSDQLVIYGNLLDWTVIIRKDDVHCIYAVNADDYSLIKNVNIEIEDNSIFGLHFTSSKDKYVYPRF